MNFQQKLFETAEIFGDRAKVFASAAITKIQTRAAEAAKRASALKGNLAHLETAGSEFGQIARRHGARFFQENSSIVRAAGKDLSVLARATFDQVTKREAAKPRRARKPAARKRAARKVA